ncbi:four helix bundle protein [Flavobacterium aurantiibacter]|uniref:Four helix bundle protein n=1 Tax=Flavobacterium aurantiibacter TaxID=2023067 RepID=A0A255ZX71_9FLAO|nr:four helix bundle protein [Flavobacterium aurantiibacter]OYQ46108.1 hypothetical protein CHX27_04965 [Flavobacterium aurantiibacter]
MAKYSSFEEMQVYQKALKFAVNAYLLANKNDSISKNFGLKDQLQRGALSISNNIAEGFERETIKEMIRFLYIAKGSAGECRNMFTFFNEMSYLSDEECKIYKSELFEISGQLGNYIKYLKNLEKQNKLSQKTENS